MKDTKDKIINIVGKQSLTKHSKFGKEHGIDFSLQYIEGTIIDIDFELEELKHVSYLKHQERKKVEKLQEAFFRLFHQFHGIPDIREFTGNNKPVEQTLMEC